ncbi:hypothetical protein [Streptomyces sp. BBFR109]|uniref:hypothetical protein n=1 Tax=Streptomyces sp. BBFR109 TaxID=3448172 RepID=UPI003F760367
MNEDIRALLIRTGGWLSAADRAVYERLVREWAEAVRAGDRTTAPAVAAAV